MKQAITVLLVIVSLTYRSEAQEPIKIIGSDTLLNLNKAWVREYLPGRKVQVDVLGGGSGVGIRSIKNGEAAIAATSRQLTDKERDEFQVLDGASPIEMEVALDAVAVFVHESNPVSWLSIEQLRKIYLGEINNWNAVGGKDLSIIRYSRNDDSGTYEFFKALVLQGQPFDKTTQFQPSTASVQSLVARSSRAIGYGGVSYASGVRVVKVIDPESNEALEPSNINVVTEMYPLSRPLYFYVRRSRWNADVEQFCRWVLSAAGQKIAVQEHFYPLPKSRRQLNLKTD